MSTLTAASRRKVNAQPRPQLSARLQARADTTTDWLASKIRRMALNDALVCTSGKVHLRLEFVQPPNSYHHFILRGAHRRIMGKVECRTGVASEEKVQRLAALLAWLGFARANTTLRAGGVERLPRSLRRIPHLFIMSDDKPPNDADEW